jgi:hypothetical protein
MAIKSQTNPLSAPSIWGNNFQGLQGFNPYSQYGKGIVAPTSIWGSGKAVPNPYYREGPTYTPGLFETNLSYATTPRDSSNDVPWYEQISNPIVAALDEQGLLMGEGFGNVEDALGTGFEGVSEGIGSLSDDIGTGFEQVGIDTGLLSDEITDVAESQETGFKDTGTAIEGVGTLVGDVETAIGNVETAVGDVGTGVSDLATAQETGFGDLSKDIENAALTFDSLTDEQKASLVGERGEGFTFADLTPEEKTELTLSFSKLTDEEKASLVGKQGEQGEQGEQGGNFEFTDFTDEQLESLVGKQGEQGGNFEFTDFTDEQLESLVGKQGETGKDGKDNAGSVTTQGTEDGGNTKASVDEDKYTGTYGGTTQDAAGEFEGTSTYNYNSGTDYDASEFEGTGSVTTKSTTDSDTEQEIINKHTANEAQLQVESVINMDPVNIEGEGTNTLYTIPEQSYGKETNNIESDYENFKGTGTQTDGVNPNSVINGSSGRGTTVEGDGDRLLAGDIANLEEKIKGWVTANTSQGLGDAGLLELDRIDSERKGGEDEAYWPILDTPYFLEEEVEADGLLVEDGGLPVSLQSSNPSDAKESSEPLYIPLTQEEIDANLQNNEEAYDAYLKETLLIKEYEGNKDVEPIVDNISLNDSIFIEPTITYERPPHENIYSTGSTVGGGTSFTPVSQVKDEELDVIVVKNWEPK